MPSTLTSSQQATARTLIASLGDNRAFTVLSGDGGSGRTMIIEQVIAELESHYQTAFIPCGRDEGLSRLRELFLSQLLPGGGWDLSLNLADLLLKQNIPGRKKILVVADDLDHAPSGFFEELKSLCQQTQGSGRFAFLASAHPLWTQNAERAAGRPEIREVAVEPLPLSESLGVAEAMFAAAGKKKLFDAISGDLPGFFERCKGNIGKVIKQTELLMDDPNLVKGGFSPEDEADLRALKKKKSRGSAGIFITVICLAIALVCLTPLFFGSSLFSDWFGSEQKSETQSKSQPALRVVTDDSAQNAFGVDGITSEEARRAQQVNSDPLRTSDPSSSDFSALGSRDRGSADHPVADDGQLLQDVSEGPEIRTPDLDTKNTVTLQGETLDAIENGEAESGKDSGLPRRGLGGSVNEAESEDGAIASPVLSRADNALRADEIRAEDEAAKQAALAKAEADRQARLADEEKARKEAEEAAAAKAKADQAAKALDEPKPKTRAVTAAARPQAGNSARAAGYSGRPRGDGIPGAEAELDGKDPNHYTLQVIAGRNRPAVVQASGAISGRYWIYETTRERRPWYVLVTGDFVSPNEALRAAASLPASLKAGKPFAKTFDRVQVERKLKSTANGQ